MTAKTDLGPLAELLTIMARLRDPEGGCPWDLEQTFATIAPYTIEEAYEVADAVERGDLADLRTFIGQRHGAGLILLNPLHAITPTLPVQASPYSPSSRRFANPLYLRVADTDGGAVVTHVHDGRRWAVDVAAHDGPAPCSSSCGVAALPRLALRATVVRPLGPAVVR